MPTAEQERQAEALREAQDREAELREELARRQAEANDRS